MKNFKMRSVNPHQFSMVPRADVPRSTFRSQATYKTTFDAGWLIPVYIDEVLPGDTFNLKMTAFTRMTTPIYPIMDNLHMESFFFFIPNRLTWRNWEKLMGERDNPGDSIDYTVPQQVSPAGGYDVASLQDYMGLPVKGQVQTGKTVSHSALFTRAYNLTWNEWFRDENLQDSVPVDLGDGPDDVANYKLLKRGKRHDYFTSALPWPQKGDAVSISLTGNAPVRGSFDLTGSSPAFVSNIAEFMRITGIQNPVYGTDYYSLVARYDTDGDGNIAPGYVVHGQAPTPGVTGAMTNRVFFDRSFSTDTLYADLSAVTAATINQLRQSFQIQRLLERDARGGTRYTEVLRSHFGVVPPDARLQRPEYIGGGYSPINVNPIAQTSASGQTGSSTPLGNLGAMATGVISGHGFNHSFVEHGIILGLVSVRADLTYQQGLPRMWSRKTRYDYYFPVFAHLGEQAILNKEIYVTGDAAQDNAVFGYQEHWAELRYKTSMITGRFRSTSPNTLDGWHLAQKFANLPALNADFIQENPPMERILAVGNQALGSQFYFDAFFDVKMTRPLPLYSVPGLMDHL